jgi:hypothetical protein
MLPASRIASDTEKAAGKAAGKAEPVSASAKGSVRNDAKHAIPVMIEKWGKRRTAVLLV